MGNRKEVILDVMIVKAILKIDDSDQITNSKKIIKCKMIHTEKTTSRHIGVKQKTKDQKKKKSAKASKGKGFYLLKSYNKTDS